MRLAWNGIITHEELFQYNTPVSYAPPLISFTPIEGMPFLVCISMISTCAEHSLGCEQQVAFPICRGSDLGSKKENVSILVRVMQCTDYSISNAPS